jgi:hypothetical protein
MLISALGFFLLAVVLGIYLLSLVLRSKQIPQGVAITHGVFAATGLILLVIYPFYFDPAPILSLVLFILAALGGFTMAYRDITGKSFPAWMALGHGTLAIVAVATLLVFILT